MAAWYVYIVRCRDGSLYTGISNDTAARVRAHNLGRGARYTRSRRPVVLVHLERRRDRSAALRREAAIKALPRLAKLALLTARATARAPLQAPATKPRISRGRAPRGRRAGAASG